MKKTLITSIGRTATVSLSVFLNSFDDVICNHEKKRSDIPMLFLSQQPTYSNVFENYCKDRLNVEGQEGLRAYVEVNPYMRFVPKKTLCAMGWNRIAIVRHPKTYIESAYKRFLFTGNDILLQQYPSNEDPVSGQWHLLSRFQKICWYYAKVHGFFISEDCSLIPFEDLISNSETLQNLLIEIGSDAIVKSDSALPLKNASNSSWSRLKNLLKSSTAPEKLDWEALSEMELNFYRQHCGEIATKMGYCV